MNWYKKSQSETGEKLLFIARGVPGSGKSSLAKKLGQGGVILSTDDFFMQNGKYNFDPSKLSQAHQWNRDRARKVMSEGISPVVIDNTNTKNFEYRDYYKMGQEFGYNIKLVEPNWSPELKTPEGKWNVDFLAGKNIHGVDRKVLERMVNNYDYNPTEEDILKSKAPWEV